MILTLGAGSVSQLGPQVLEALESRGKESCSMKDTLEAINEMQSHGVIGKYAIGGAVGATFYLEPAATLDVDVFVVLPTVAGSLFVTLTPIYEYLTARGCRIEGEHIVIGTWPVQFLPANDALELEALNDAVSTEVDGVQSLGYDSRTLGGDCAQDRKIEGSCAHFAVSG